MPRPETFPLVSIDQEGGHTLLLTELRAIEAFEAVTALVNKEDALPAPFIALASQSVWGGNWDSTDDQLLHEAIELNAGARMIEQGSVPIVGLDHDWLSVGLTAADGKLTVFAAETHEPSGLEVRCDSLFVRPLAEARARQASYLPELFQTSVPTLVMASEQEEGVLDGAFRESKEAGGGSLVAIGEHAVNDMLTMTARQELMRSTDDQQQFEKSAALLALAALKEQGQELPLSTMQFVREAGQKAVSALITGTAAINGRFIRDLPGDGIDSLIERLGGISFVASDHASITLGILDAMKGRGRNELTKLASDKGGTIEEYASAQALGFLQHVLGVQVIG
jgi:hypothetical protein